MYGGVERPNKKYISSFGRISKSFEQIKDSFGRIQDSFGRISKLLNSYISCSERERESFVIVTDDYTCI